MIVTLPYLKRQFDEFNKLCFDEQLPMPRLREGRAKTMLGCVRYKKEEGFLRKERYYDFILIISSRYDMPEDMLEDTILHEMIHLYILTSHQKDDSAHGPLFRSIMKQLNTHYGRHITISVSKARAKELKMVDISSS